MFWRTQIYDANLPAHSFQQELQHFAEANQFTMSGSEQAGKFLLTTSEVPGTTNLFSVHIAFMDKGAKRFFKVQLNPNNWILALMVLLAALAIAAFISPSKAGSLGYSIPVLLVIPYMYAIYAHRILTEIKDILIHGYLDTAEGKKEMFKGYMSPLSWVLNIQAYLYIGFVVVFITVIVLWMLGVFDSLHLKDLFP